MKDHQSIIPVEWHESWNSVMDDTMLATLNRINDEITESPFLPDTENVMRFLSLDLTRTKCVIIGMDPYPTCFSDNDGIERPQATGRSFEVGKVRYRNDWNFKFKQSSLQNIVKAIHLAVTGERVSLDEIRRRISVGEFDIALPADLFDGLERQGVMFLNSALTVAPNAPGSHSGLWKAPMSRILRHIEKTASPVWFLWGRQAQELACESIQGIPSDRMVKTKHPRLASFVDEDCFSRVVDIDWACADFHTKTNNA